MIITVVNSKNEIFTINAVDFIKWMNGVLKYNDGSWSTSYKDGQFNNYFEIYINGELEMLSYIKRMEK